MGREDWLMTATERRRRKSGRRRGDAGGGTNGRGLKRTSGSGAEVGACIGPRREGREGRPRESEHAGCQTLEPVQPMGQSNATVDPQGQYTHFFVGKQFTGVFSWCSWLYNYYGQCNHLPVYIIFSTLNTQHDYPRKKDDFTAYP